MCVCVRETSSAFVITLTQVQVQSTKLCVCLVHGKMSHVSGLPSCVCLRSQVLLSFVVVQTSL